MDLSARAAHLTECMEDPRCDGRLLHNTYRQFHAVNLWFAQWRRTYARFLRPQLRARDRTWSILDVGFGGGDIARSIACWARRDGLRVELTGIDRDERSLAFVRRRNGSRGVRFRKASLAEVVASGARFDYVLSNHLLHHQEPAGVRALCDETASIARRGVIMSDIARSPWAYAGFAAITRPLFRRSFVVHDGLISIRRSYTREELRTIVPRDWTVHAVFPFRLVLVYRGDA